MDRFADLMLKYPRLVFWLIIGISFLAILPASQIRTDFNLENFYPKKDSTVLEYQELVNDFGRDDNVIIIGYKKDDLASVEGIKLVEELTNQFKEIPNLEEVSSLFTVQEIKNDDGNLTFNPYFEGGFNETDIKNAFKKLQDNSFTQGTFINAENNVTAFYLFIDESVNGFEVRNQISADIKRIAANYSDIDFKISGLPYFRNEYVSVLNGEVIFYILFSSVLIILLLWYLYRSLPGIFIPMLIVWLTVLFTVAAISLTGGYLEVMSSTIAPILLCVGVADSIHMISKYDDALQHGFEKNNAIREMLKTLGSATFLTSLTTAIGFATLVTSDVIPMRRFGLYTALGVLLAFLVTILLLPSLLRILKIKRIFSDNGGGLYIWLGKWLLQVSAFNKRNHKVISIVSLIVTFFFILGMFQLQVNGKVFDDLSDDSVLIQDSNFFSENLSPAFPLEILIDTKTENGVISTEFISKVDDLNSFLLSFPEIKKATSISSLVTEVHKVMSPNEFLENKIPQSDQLLAQYLLLLEINGNELLSNVTDFSYQKARISALTLDAGSIRINEIREDLKIYIDQNFPNEDVILTGSTVLSANLVDKMVYSLASSIGLAFICISFLMAFLFRNLKMVLISLIPNIIPLIIMAGIMGFLGIDIKPSTAVIFTIAFGIAVDDTIHFLARFRVELKRGMKLEDAIEITTQKTGRAIIITSLILWCGFGTLITSAFTSTALMGILVSGTILFAVIADLILLPALFYWFKPNLESLAEQEITENSFEFAG